MAPATCGLFDIRPKADRRYVFGRDREIDELERLLNAGFWPVLLGPRRVGKTTLMKVAVKELSGIYIDASTAPSLKALGLRLIDEARRVGMRIKLNLSVLQIEIERRPSATLERIIKELGDVVIAVDEIQNVVSPRLPALLSVLYNEARVRFLFSGSLVGTMKLIMKSPESLGRPLVKLELRPFSPEESAEFLRRGFEECGVEVGDAEIEEAVEELDGIVGWLTYYGSLRAGGKRHREALAALSETARELVRSELGKLGRHELAIYKALAALGKARWAEIKKFVEAQIGHALDDKTFSVGLKALANMYLVREVDRGLYEVVDKFMAGIARIL